MPAEDASQHDEVERDRDEIEMLSALSTEMVALHKTQLGRGPTRPRRTATHDASARSATPSSLTDFAPWTRWLVVVMAGTMLLFGIDIVLHPFPAAVSDPFQKFVSCAIFFGAAALCVMKGLASKHERSAWWLFALAMALWGAGAVYFAVVLWNTEEPPVPSIADGFWLVFYLPAYAALYKLLRKRSGSARRGVWLDALVGGLGVGAAGAALVFQVVLANTEGTVAATATNLAYPLGDLGLLALVVAAITVTGWRAAGVWTWIAAAFAIFAVADGIYLVQIAEGSYVGGGLVDLGWPAAALLVGFAAWRPEARAPSDVRTGPAIVVPAVFGLTALALLVSDHFVRTNPLALGLATASIFVIVIRLYLTVQDNGRMLAQSRREAATDALTGLGNRRQLAADLAAHLDELDTDRPLMLTLFDLDGFKHYNDTFGHLAGDQLLERLGARLSEVLTGRGTAYRMGGDEFCALWTLWEVDQASVTTSEAVAALSERGEAFSIGCSYGSVVLPNETTAPTDALRIADRRMYIRKSSGPASAGRQSSDVLLRALAERDSELGLHLGGVAELACATALRLGVPREDMEVTRQTALLHDVGKVAIPDEILSKPEPLDESEWAFMKRHTIIGERIISAAPALEAVATLVRSTHERYDGGGYPDGLAGADIPLIARIVGVCDAYDAMVTNRTYRRAFDRSRAISEVRRSSGTQFDPKVVEAFVSALEAVGGPPAEAEAKGPGLGDARRHDSPPVVA
jgi:two-component system cell cycle response regulator